MPRLRTLMALSIWGCQLSQAACLLSNPSFEGDGGGAGPLSGWTVLGPAQADTLACHGRHALRVQGSVESPWALSGCWQALPCSPGQTWTASGVVRPAFALPAGGQSRGLVNVEWRDAAQNLIAYESATVADGETPLDGWSTFVVSAGPAPAGTSSVRLVPGLLQAPGEGVWELRVDQLDFQGSRTPSLDEIQWLDFPGGRQLDFGGRSWRVKGPGWYGPGPNTFEDDEELVWVDAQQRLHLGIRQLNGQWCSSEVTLVDTLGYGDYIFTTQGALQELDPHVVLGLFIWQYAPCYDSGDAWWNPYNEIDVEFSRWGNPADQIGQFVAQPWNGPDNIRRFNATYGEQELSSHAFRWLPQRVEFRSWRGGPLDENPASLVQAWTYEGPHVPRPEQPRVHINLWQTGGAPATEQEVILSAFTFVPPGGSTSLPPPPQQPVSLHLALGPAAPNPFNGLVRIPFTLQVAGVVELELFQLNGARVRCLLHTALEAGSHQASWDGRDDRGMEMASGLYLLRMRMGQELQSCRVALLR